VEVIIFEQVNTDFRVGKLVNNSCLASGLGIDQSCPFSCSEGTPGEEDTNEGVNGVPLFLGSYWIELPQQWDR
jgi:hypothetical protein